MGTPEIPGIMLPMWLADHPTFYLEGVSLCPFSVTPRTSSIAIHFSTLPWEPASSQQQELSYGQYSWVCVLISPPLVPMLVSCQASWLYGDSSIGIRQRCNTVKPKCPIYSNGNFHYLLCENHKLGDQAVLRLIFFPQSRGIWVVGEGL